ncbi:chromate transporter%2C chromate ion transporter (CHR) family [uncultured Roseburia sp.]|uniref:Chromate transporter n=1 Tax=Brotonthovivens ammoniilytica TaxID=2981725 RepID=A0ABT2TFM4_9FIRM|nr:chromate transporter [Brotonthovivens ammoniilytica]MCU6760998.1 chromate transporter [Brotonthovivens ammoniilytica]SCI15864.1 chromate transporter%2C chromate ion transporter (CHR) family [uncultured Roseburia sp.]
MTEHTKKEKKSGKMGKLLSVMFKTGCIGFGGGSALIPVIEEEAVSEYQLIDENEYNKDVIVANITPGALPVEIAAGIGRKVNGIRGMILAAVLMAVPGTFLTVAIISMINKSSSGLLQQILFASAGVTAYIIFMLIEYAKGTFRECRINRNARSGMFFLAAVFLATSGKELFQIFQLDATPVFDISTIQILAMTFFVIFFTRGKMTRVNTVISAAVVVLYMLCVGKAHLISAVWFRSVLQILMIVLALFGLSRSLKGRMQFSLRSFKKLLAEEVSWFLFLIILSIPAFILCKDTLLFAGKGLLSAVLSFGGGDAYLAIADGMFVNTDMISYSDFYQKIAASANALPGSILCKVLAGIGYVIGYGAENNMLAGFALALCGFACSVAASGGTFSAAMYIYERFENLDIFYMIKIYIRPIVAGLLLSVSASMLYQNMEIAAENSWPFWPVLLLTGGIYLGNLWWKKRGKVRPIFMVLLSAGISLGACNLLGLWLG